MVSRGFIAQMPGLIEKDASEGTDLAEASTGRLATAGLAILIPVAVVGALALDPLLSLAAGESFRGANEAVVPALAVLPLIPLAGLANQVAALRLRPDVRLRATALGAVAFGAVARLVPPRPC
jgi:O-antigen/teichoic acid export membrane protein